MRWIILKADEYFSRELVKDLTPFGETNRPCDEMQIFMQAAAANSETSLTLLYGCFTAKMLSFYYLKRHPESSFL